jgi:putative transposase
MCAQLGVTEQGYYQWLKRKTPEREIENDKLKTQIAFIFEKLKGNPGRRRIKAELVTYGYRIGINRVGRLMKSLGLVGRHPRAWKKTTTRGEKPNYAKDLIKGNFKAAKPNQKWVGDITYIKTWDGWAYLATVIDLHSRKVVGWAIVDHMRTDLVVEALQMAITHRKPKGKVIFHSDKGTQYTSDQFKEFCENNGVRRSMGRTGVCYDNAVAESFFASYKKELIHTRPWPSLRALKRATFHWIEIYYNRERRHSTIGYLTPDEIDVGNKSLEELYAKAA